MGKMNFAEALNTKVSDIEKPPLLPKGIYKAFVKKVPEQGSVSDGKYETLDFTLQMREAVEGVDEDELAKFGGCGPLATVRRRFMFDTDDENKFNRTLYDLRRFLLDHLKLAGDDNTPLKQLLNESVNAECIVQVRWRQDPNDAEVWYVEPGKVLPVE